jgi:hypothetical protein
MTEIREINFKDFCRILNEAGMNFSPVLFKLEKSDMRYEMLNQTEKETIITEILKKLDFNTFSITGDASKWHSGWGENLKEYEQTKDLNSLIPKYRGRGLICRLNGEYIRPLADTFEIDMYILLQYYAFCKYFSNVTNVFEFGCGTGINLKNITDIYPKMTVHGLDWVKESVETVRLIRKFTGIDAYGHLFDMFHPNENLDMPENSGVFTYHSLEQLGTDFQPFLDFLLKKKPKIVINFEPILEFYNDANLLDYLAIKFHKKRKYLEGYYTALSKLEAEGKIKILKSHKTPFGSFYQDSSSIIVWEIL